MIDFPSFENAPARLLALEGNCGVLAAWGVLRYFHKRTSAMQLIQACRYTRKHGVFAIALAIALKEHGLSVTFYSDPDPAPNLIERRCYRTAEQMGLPVLDAIEIEQFLGLLTPKTIPIILYETDEGNGHFSPITEYAEGSIHLPYAEAEERRSTSVEDLRRRWSAPEIYRQCILVAISA